MHTPACDCRPTYSAPSQCIFFVMRTDSTVRKGISWHFSSVIDINTFYFCLGISCNYYMVGLTLGGRKAKCQVKVSHFQAQHKKQPCISSVQSIRIYSLKLWDISVIFSIRGSRKLKNANNYQPMFISLCIIFNMFTCPSYSHTSI